MIKRLSENEHLELAKKIRSMHNDYWDVYHMMTGHFPKRSKAIQHLFTLHDVMMELDFQLEGEFFKAFPEKKRSDYRPPIWR